MAAAYLDAIDADPSATGGPAGAGCGVRHRQQERWTAVLAAARAGVNSPLTSSAGRLFDAVASLLDLRDEVSYEGQAAIELEQLADPDEPGGYAVGLGPDGVTALTCAAGTGAPDAVPATLRSTDLVRAVLADAANGVDAARIAARFHRGVSELVIATCRAIREGGGSSTVALSGGVFQNVLLLRLCVAGLEAGGFTVLTHHQVPPNDGGISLGQAVVAAARDRLGG
jgi:hydrogenase maturation protein HypF